MIENIEDAITLSMQEASMKSEIEAQERRLKWASEIIRNRGKKQGRKLSRSEREHAMKQAMMNWDE